MSNGGGAEVVMQNNDFHLHLASVDFVKNIIVVIVPFCVAKTKHDEKACCTGCPANKAVTSAIAGTQMTMSAIGYSFKESMAFKTIVVVGRPSDKCQYMRIRKYSIKNIQQKNIPTNVNEDQKK